MDTIESLSREIIALQKEFKECEDLVKKDLIKLELDKLRARRKQLNKEKIVIPKELPKEDIIANPMEKPALVLETPDNHVHKGNPILNSVMEEKPKKVGLTKAQLASMAIAKIMRIMGKTVPYCEGCESSIEPNELVEAVQMTIDGFAEDGIDIGKYIKPWAILAGTIFTGIGGTMAQNYEKKTGKPILVSLMQSQQPIQQQNTTDSGNQQK